MFINFEYPRVLIIRNHRNTVLYIYELANFSRTFKFSSNISPLQALNYELSTGNLNVVKGQQPSNVFYLENTSSKSHLAAYHTCRVMHHFESNMLVGNSLKHRSIILQ